MERVRVSKEYAWVDAGGQKTFYLKTYDFDLRDLKEFSYQTLRNFLIGLEKLSNRFNHRCWRLHYFIESFVSQEKWLQKKVSVYDPPKRATRCSLQNFTLICQVLQLK
jgi:hypothetical protein